MEDSRKHWGKKSLAPGEVGLEKGDPPPTFRMLSRVEAGQGAHTHLPPGVEQDQGTGREAIMGEK